MHPLERLINLVALLLSTSRPLTFEEIRTSLGAYDQADRESAKRQFERDKDALRKVGIPVEVAPTDPWEVEEGYRISRERYELPDITFTPEEAAALFVAAHGTAETPEAAEAFRKLLPGAERGVMSALGDRAVAAVDVSGPHLQQIAGAVAGRRRITFRYRPSEGEEAERHVDAWGLVFRRGAWYLVGGDRDRGEPRSYRLSRVASAVRDSGTGDPPPPEFRAADHLTAGPWGVGEPESSARVAFSPKVAWWALSSLQAERIETGDDGWTEAVVPAGAPEPFVAWILSFGPDAVVRGPESLRRAVVEALEGIRAAL